MTVELPPTIVRPGPDPLPFDAGSFSYSYNERDREGRLQLATFNRMMQEISIELKRVKDYLDSSYGPLIVEAGAAALGNLIQLGIPSDTDSSSAADIEEYINIVDRLLVGATYEIGLLASESIKFSGTSVLDLSAAQIKAANMSRIPKSWRAWGPFPKSEYGIYQSSYRAALQSQVVGETFKVLQERKSNLNSSLEQARERESSRDNSPATGTYHFQAGAAAALTVPGLGVIPLTEAVISALGKSIADAVVALRRILMAGPGAPFAAALTAVVYSSATASEEQDQTPRRFRYGLGLNANDLGFVSDGDFMAMAAAQNKVELLFRLTSEIRSDGTSYVSLFSTQSANVSNNVPARVATLNPQTGNYSVTVQNWIPDEPPLTLTWTPAKQPGYFNSSTTTPAVAPSLPTYTGLELQPVDIVTTYPGSTPEPIDLVVIFPQDSGLEPVYLMFTDPLDSGIFTRRQLDKKFKHAIDFGVSDTQKNRETLTRFRDAMQQHLDDPGTVERGTYRREPGSKVYFNPSSNKVVVVRADGDFLSGWSLEPGSAQFNNYIETGVL